MQSTGIEDPCRVYTAAEFAPGKNPVFAACGVTDGNLLRGDGMHTQSGVMTSTPARVRFVETTHLENRRDVKVRVSVGPCVRME